MTIAPFVENPEDNRTYFRQIRQLSVDIDAQNIDNVRMDILSMGMTGDYMVAIEEGATWFVLEPEFSAKDIIKNKVVKNEYY